MKISVETVLFSFSNRTFITCLFVLPFISCNVRKNVSEELTTWIAKAPAQEEYCVINKEGTSVIPNGRFLTPAGKQIMVAPHPFGLTLSPDGKTIVTSNSGTAPFSISIISDYLSASPKVQQVPEGMDGDEGLLEAVFMGLAVSPDNRLVYVAGGQQNKIYYFDVASGTKEGEISCLSQDPALGYNDGYIGDMVMNREGTRIYAVDQIGFRMVVIDTKSGKMIQEVPTGRYPFGITLSPDEKTVYVANVGMFEYSYVKSLDSVRLKETALKFPAFAYGSKEMQEGIRNDSVEVAGLGDPNAPESFSVWAIDLSNDKPVVVAKVKTGVLVGDAIDGIPAVGGSSPNSIVATDKAVYVSNGNNDNVSVIDIKRNEIVGSIELRPDERLGNLKGVIPFGLAVSPDQKKLFVAEAGINAVAVVDLESREVLGHIPTGWFPSKLKVTPDGKTVIVSNAKGYGSGPNGGKTFNKGPEGSYIGSLMKGTVSVIDIPSKEQLKKYTEQVIANNFRFEKAGQSNTGNPIPEYPGVSESPIRYVVFISKENRTYDQIFGKLPSGKGDSSLAIYAQDVSFSNRKGTRSVKNVTVMPNHLELARQFGISDNFYVDADVSADGHVWLTNTYPNQWMETHHPASYGGRRHQTVESNAPGKFGITGAAGAIFPESYNQHGSMWDHLFRNGIEFYNFGFGVEFDNGNVSDSTMKYGGVRYLVNYPVPGPIFDRTSRLFPTYNMAIPDQFRAQVFIDEINEKFISKKKELPRVLTLQLLNDHGAGERAHAGFPFMESYMADNDLALGRVVEFLSHTPYWKNMMIVVTEDDAQGGNDHIDAHRSILMVISPYAKKNHNSHVHYSFGSIFKSFWNVLGIPYLNQYDYSTNDLSDFFTPSPDYTPYKAVATNPNVFDPAKALSPFDETFDWNSLRESPKFDDPEEIKKAREDDARMKVNH